ncbi:hypothetical protein CEXT_365461 [Caerostris extrusa]|uniref:Uncharacterized protein n=1 Tax=Caerostris extrusa TaxID=172846 RepID=A0AAV4Q0H4_CAEEX|nr:hypothetical protein CEXT_365461 [Caerostris extrusa]
MPPPGCESEAFGTNDQSSSQLAIRPLKSGKGGYQASSWVCPIHLLEWAESSLQGRPSASCQQALHVICETPRLPELMETSPEIPIKEDSRN